MDDTVKKLFEELVNYENMLILKDVLAGEKPTVEEMIHLHELRLQAYSYGYIIPTEYTIH